MTVAQFVADVIAGKYVPPPPKEKKKDNKLFELSGIILVPNVVELTPPYVDEVRAESPAAKAGLRPDDLIFYLNGERVVSIKEFQDALKQYDPGEELKVEVRRGDSLTTLTLKIDDKKK